ncbi:MAG: hypothetical protein V1798_05935 [Pseudomonadota bacterium]
MAGQIFDIIMLNGRPASGKSEILDFLKKTPLEERIRRFHVGEFEEFDDFPILWDAFEDDDIFEKHGKARLISNPTFTYKGETQPGYSFKDKFYWNFLIMKLCRNYAKKLARKPDYHRTTTAIFEFARGSEHGGWRDAYPCLTDDVLKKACTVYINVPWEESLRKNRKRRKPGMEDSILFHSLEDLKMEMLYKDSDWEEFTKKDPNCLSVRGFKVPYVVFENMPDKTTDMPPALGPYLEETLGKLWKTKQGRS